MRHRSRDLLNDDGNFLTFQEFTDKYPCKTNFLQYYQIINAIPKDLLLKAKSLDSFDKSPFLSNDTVFNLNDTLQIHLEKAKSRVFYKLLNDKIKTDYQTGPQKWSKYLSVDGDSWTKTFKSLRKVCKETKLKELQFKLIHRIVVTKKRNYLNMVSKLMINACTAEKEIPLNTRLLTVYVLRRLSKNYTEWFKFVSDLSDSCRTSIWYNLP